MKRIIILSAFFIGLSIMFSSGLVSIAIINGSSNLFYSVTFLSGLAIVVVVILIVVELADVSSPPLSDKEKQFLKDNDVDL